MSLSDRIKKLESRVFPEAQFSFCLNPGLSSERERLLQELARERSSNRRSTNASQVLKKIGEIEARIREAIVTIRVVGLPFEEYNAIQAKHPPRKNKAEAYNPVTFFGDVTYRTGVYVEDGEEPVSVQSAVSRAEWDKLVKQMTNAEYTDMANAVIRANNENDVPGFLLPVSGTTRDSDVISASPEESV